ncbi:MerC domain-containing protein [Sphingosinicella sp. CPCC 101087]|uniref:MerC domain-containing protein n=1 Tax=Sphingosinicella sp. CPCC 101087 TaxID=2497754 RepID=UPI001982698E|nr:MerC domain-containing protein [Sphingosinicella sp. CPCC 101087]
MKVDMIEGAAIGGSLLCLLHCFALPLLILLLPGMVGLFFASPVFHQLALALVLPAATLAFGLGYRLHRAVTPVLLGVLGMLFLGAGLAPGLSEGAETGTTVIGSLLLMMGHGVNWRLRAHAF